jgi:alcohol dehydrogenase
MIIDRSAPPVAEPQVVSGRGEVLWFLGTLAFALGAEAVTYVDADERRRCVARTLGATTLGEAPKRLGPFPITVDASANADGLRLALRSTAPDGTCTSAAVYFDEQPSLPLLEMYTKGITFHTGRAHAREAMLHVLELAASGALRPEAVTSRVVTWADAADALVETDWTKLVISR